MAYPFKAFFRSRSRSRSRSQTSDSNIVPPSLPSPQRDTPSSPENPPSSYLKSTLRSQNRPISSTTTATHSTITPLPSDALRNRANLARHAYAYQFHSTDTHTSRQAHDQYTDTCDYDSDDNRVPRSETPSSTRPKLVWHSLFGISLTRKSSSTISTPSQSITGRKGSTSTSASDPKIISPRKRSFRFTSRPSTPKSIDSSSSKSPYPIPVPSSPLPLSASPRRRSFGLGSSQRSTPKSSTGHLPLPHVQSPQPGRSHGRRHSVGSERPPHDSAVALPEEPPHRSVHKSGPDAGARNKGKERENLFADPDRPLPPSFDFPSQSLPPDHSRNHLSPDLTRLPVSSRLPTVYSASSEENDQSSHRLQIPRIIHTPPTPQRPAEVASPSRPSNALPKVDSGKIQVAKGKPVAMAHREQVLVSSSQSHADVQHTPTSKGRFTARFHVPKTKDGIGQKSSKRSPAGSSDGPTHKLSGPSIIGPPRNMTSHRGKLGSFDFERPVSALNRSSSTMERQKTLAPADNSSYSKGRLHALERTLSEDSAQAESSATPQLKPDHTGDTSVVSFSSLSLQTKSTGKDLGNNTPPGQSSSWGRASGKRVLRASHGTFAFEPPSSLPNSPNLHIFNLPSEPHQNGLSEPTSGLAQSQPSTPKHSRGQSYNTSDHAEPGYHPGERKPKGKGRSLDLGLGLSWAPSRLREEVLMPGSILAREKAKLEKNRTNGSNVTKMFESLLSESRFQTFKKYVRSFDAHNIPFEGPSGLLASVEKLVAESGLSERERKKLMSEFTLFVENHGG
ncbi:hypothetical protein L210DRAFT_3756162 [Boletus edulis BED1]|uniref:Uncharacterized protein n=1 Tax=Boletus edulis BED1 TaxID=1328754 RepID=A0AAD4GM26_BOLED|nr:hypothetical protein L210DRAFT_3756162 [Boletus edulis BED1]